MADWGRETVLKVSELLKRYSSEGLKGSAASWSNRSDTRGDSDLPADRLRRGWRVRWQVHHSEPMVVFHLAHMVSGEMLDLARVQSPVSWSWFSPQIQQKLNQISELSTGQIRLIFGPECSQDSAGSRVRFLTGVEPLWFSGPVLQKLTPKTFTVHHLQTGHADDEVGPAGMVTRVHSPAPSQPPLSVVSAQGVYSLLSADRLIGQWV